MAWRRMHNRGSRADRHDAMRWVRPGTIGPCDRAGAFGESKVFRFQAHSALLLLTAAIAIGVAWAIRQRHASTSARYLMHVQVACALWAFFDAFEVAATPLPLKTMFTVLGYPWMTAGPPLLFLFSLTHTNHGTTPPKAARRALMAVSALFALAAATNPWHHLLWPNITLDPATNLARYAHGPLFWVVVLYVYCAFAGAIVVLMRGIFHAAHIYRRQMIAILAAVLVVVLANVLHIAGFGPSPGMDWTPLSFMISSLLVAWAIYGLRLFQLAPIARSHLVKSMSDAVFVLDPQGVVVEANPAAVSLIGRASKHVAGRAIGQLLPGIAVPDAPHAKAATGEPHAVPSPAAAHSDYARSTPSGERHYEMRLSSFMNDSGATVGRLLVLRDVTQHIAMARQREALIEELRATLEQVVTLGRLLPICSKCSKVRDDDGYWQSVEAYVTAHSDAEFTHGICPDCMRALYPMLYAEAPGQVAGQNRHNTDRTPGQEGMR